MPKTDAQQLPIGTYYGSFDQGGTSPRRVPVTLRKFVDLDGPRVYSWACDEVDGAPWNPEWGPLLGCLSPRAAIRERLWRAEAQACRGGKITIAVFRVEIEGDSRAL